MGTSKLLILCNEILVEILFLLPARDIVACSRTCHLLHTLVLDTQLLQYVIRAHCAAVDDRFQGDLTVPERFAVLERWEEAWGDSDGLNPSGGRFELMTSATSDVTHEGMLRDGFLIVAHLKYDAEHQGIAGYSALDLRSPAAGWRNTEIHSPIIAFDCSIEQNLVATLHTNIDGAEERLLLTLSSFDDSLGGLATELGGVVVPIRMERYSCDDVDLKIAGSFVGVMSCGIPGQTPSDADLFTLVDWVRKKPHNMICGAAGTYGTSFAFIDHETVAHVNRSNGTIETRKICLSDDGQISLELRKVLGVPVVSEMGFQLINAVWSGDHPSFPVSSPVVRPDDRKRPPSALPFQSSFKSSIVALAIFYMAKHPPPMRLEMKSLRAFIPRAELLDLDATWSTHSFFSVHLGLGAPPKCAISGTRWINRCLEVFDFNRIRLQIVQARQRAPHERDTSPPVMGQSSFQYLHLSPLYKPAGDYDDILADDERIVGFRCMDDNEGLHTNIVFDVHTLKTDGMERWRNPPTYRHQVTDMSS